MTAYTPPVAQQTRTSVLAIAGLVCGILGFCTAGLGGLAGLIIGIVAIVLIGRSGGQLKGKGLAIGGIVAGILSILVWVLVIVAVVGFGLLGRQSFHEARTHSFSQSEPMAEEANDLAETSGAFKAFSDALKRRDCARLAELSRGESVPTTAEEWREMLASPTMRVPGTGVLMSGLPEAMSRSGGYSGSSMNDEAKYESAGVTFHFKRLDDGRWYFCGFE